MGAWMRISTGSIGCGSPTRCASLLGRLRRSAVPCGFRTARAELVVFLDSDDLLEPHCLGRRVALMARNADLDFATFQTAVFRRTPWDLGRQLNPELLGDDLLRFLFFECPWIITAPVWR